MAAVPMLAGVGLMMVCCSSLSSFMMMGDGDDDKKKKAPAGPTGPIGPTGPSPGPSADDDDAVVVPPTTFRYVGDGGCHNYSTKPGKSCRDNTECDYIGQQPNGCWHLLDSTGTGQSIDSYSKKILPITPVPTNYKYVGDGGCHSDSMNPANSCRSNTECDYIGQQPNGCWHLLDSTGTGQSKDVYSNGIMSVE